MAFMEWKDSYSVNVVKFDVQHKKLFALINDLHTAMSTGKGKDIIGGVLSELINYTKKHFTEEEEAMRFFVYPELLSQNREHKKFTDKIIKFQEQYERGEKSISIDLMFFLTDWLKNHIMISDKKYSAFFKGKNV